MYLLLLSLEAIPIHRCLRRTAVSNGKAVLACFVLIGRDTLGITWDEMATQGLPPPLSLVYKILSDK